MGRFQSYGKQIYRRFFGCLSPNLADRGKEFDFVESCATITNSYIQRLKNMRCMRWKPERNNPVVVAVLNTLNGMMEAAAIQKKKSFRAFCELS
jgi:hypothetical protein